MKNKMTDLRNHLFEMLENLKDPEASVDLERMKAGVEVARVLVDTAKVEVQFLTVTGRTEGSDFIDQEAGLPAPNVARIGGRK